jgi:hypothetical protein
MSKDTKPTPPAAPAPAAPPAAPTAAVSQSEVDALAKEVALLEQRALLRKKKEALEQEEAILGLRKDDGVVKGEATYRLTERHYRKGVTYLPGDLITVTDEKPGRTWVRVDGAKGEKLGGESPVFTQVQNQSL